VKVPAIIVAVTLLAAILVTTSLLVLGDSAWRRHDSAYRTTVLGARLQSPLVKSGTWSSALADAVTSPARERRS
jgi:hypothetical protein